MASSDRPFLISFGWISGAVHGSLKALVLILLIM